MKINYNELKEQAKNFFPQDKLYDFIIIGSGPAAITLSKKLLLKKHKPKILILEEGDYQKKKL